MEPRTSSAARRTVFEDCAEYVWYSDAVGAAAAMS